MTLVADASTDHGNLHHVTLLLQAIEDNVPVTYFYGLVEIKKESAEEQKNAILKAFEQDDLLEVMAKRIIALVTDGAAVICNLTEINHY